MLPSRLPWAAQARLMAAYAVECRAVALDTGIRGNGLSRQEWQEEARLADREVRKYLALRDADTVRPLMRAAGGSSR